MKKQIICTLLFFVPLGATAQPQLEPWGNLAGIRVRGTTMAFETSVRRYASNGDLVAATGKEQQSPKYHRQGDRQIVITALGNTGLVETVTDTLAGAAGVRISGTPAGDSAVEIPSVICFVVHLSLTAYAGGRIFAGGNAGIPVTDIPAGKVTVMLTRNIRLDAPLRRFTLSADSADSLQIIPGTGKGGGEIEIRVPLHRSLNKAGAGFDRRFLLTAGGKSDDAPITLALDTTASDDRFAGLGGNFRIQNLKNDPAVIDYCLRNLRVAWGRVEMPWRFWQPEQGVDPVAAARAGGLDSHVVRAMEMAKRLAEKNIPVILTAWFPPAWAVVGKPVMRHRPGEAWGNPLNADSMPAIYRSIADYIQYLKSEYGVDVRFFSFNESDLGINIRQTGEEHRALIKGLGAYFVSRGLPTKLLLGDNSDATTWSFLGPALQDTSCYPYIGAVSFHSWRGWDDSTLAHWTAAARQIRLPLLVGEGSIDAAAWAYPEIFQEPVYSLAEIGLYIRLLANCHPESILQWQLTADYSPVAGGGIYGDSGAIVPTVRFRNLKQLAATPEGLAYESVTGAPPTLTAAALGDNRTGTYVLHLVNNGPLRKVTLQGLPLSVHALRWSSTAASGKETETRTLEVRRGEVSFFLPATAFASLVTAPAKGWKKNNERKRPVPHG